MVSDCPPLSTPDISSANALRLFYRDGPSILRAIMPADGRKTAGGGGEKADADKVWDPTIPIKAPKVQQMPQTRPKRASRPKKVFGGPKRF